MELWARNFTDGLPIEKQEAILQYLQSKKEPPTSSSTHHSISKIDGILFHRKLPSNTYQMAPKIDSVAQDDDPTMTELKALFSATQQDAAKSPPNDVAESQPLRSSMMKSKLSKEKKIVRFAEPGTRAKRSAKEAAKSKLQRERCLGRLQAPANASSDSVRHLSQGQFRQRIVEEGQKRKRPDYSPPTDVVGTKRHRQQYDEWILKREGKTTTTMQWHKIGFNQPEETSIKPSRAKAATQKWKYSSRPHWASDYATTEWRKAAGAAESLYRDEHTKYTGIKEMQAEGRKRHEKIIHQKRSRSEPIVTGHASRELEMIKRQLRYRYSTASACDGEIECISTVEVYNYIVIKIDDAYLKKYTLRECIPGMLEYPDTRIWKARKRSNKPKPSQLPKHIPDDNWLSKTQLDSVWIQNQLREAERAELQAERIRRIPCPYLRSLPQNNCAGVWRRISIFFDVPTTRIQIEFKDFQWLSAYYNDPVIPDSSPSTNIEGTPLQQLYANKCLLPPHHNESAEQDISGEVNLAIEHKLTQNRENLATLRVLLALPKSLHDAKKSLNNILPKNQKVCASEAVLELQKSISVEFKRRYQIFERHFKSALTGHCSNYLFGCCISDGTLDMSKVQVRVDKHLLTIKSDEECGEKITALLREHAHFHHFLRTCYLLVTQLNFYSEMLSDQTRIANTTWSKLKEVAMGRNIEQQSWFVSLPNQEKELLTRLISAQRTQGNMRQLQSKQHKFQSYEYGQEKKDFVSQCLDLKPHGSDQYHEHALLNNMADFVRLSKYTVKQTQEYKKYNTQSMTTRDHQAQTQSIEKALKQLKKGCQKHDLPTFKLTDVFQSMHVYFKGDKVYSCTLKQETNK